MENVMMNSIRTQIKIVDFGLSNAYDPSSPLRTHCGSPEYAAPELFVPGRSYGPEVDLWSLGVILYGMVAGQLPFVTNREENVSSQERRKRLLVQINKGYSSTQRKTLALVSPDFRAMISRMLVADAQKRITTNELIFHSWVTDKGRKIIVTNPLKGLDEDWQISIMKQVGTLLQLDWTTVRYAIKSEPQGDIAGMYNILAYKLQAQCLEGDGVTKALPSQIPSYATPRGATVDVRKESPTCKKRIERIKSPPIHKLQKVSVETTPRIPPVKRHLHLEKRPQSTAGAIRARKLTKDTPRTYSGQQKLPEKRQSLPADTRNRMHVAAEVKHSNLTDVQWRYVKEQTIPPPSEAAPRAVSVPLAFKPHASLSASPQSPSAKMRVRPVQGMPKLGTPRTSFSKNYKNEVQVAGSKGLAKVLVVNKAPSKSTKPTPRRSADTTPHKSTDSNVENAGLSKCKSASEAVRRLTAPPASATLQSTKRSRVNSVTASPSDPSRRMSAPTPPTPAARSRRVQTSQPISSSVERSPLALGDACSRRATSTTAKHVHIQRTVLSDPIARSIAGYIANNIPSKEASKWMKSYPKASLN